MYITSFHLIAAIEQSTLSEVTVSSFLI